MATVCAILTSGVGERDRLLFSVLGVDCGAFEADLFSTGLFVDLVFLFEAGFLFSLLLLLVFWFMGVFEVLGFVFLGVVFLLVLLFVRLAGGFLVDSGVALLLFSPEGRLLFVFSVFVFTLIMV